MPDLNALSAALKMVRDLPDTLWPDFQPADVPLVVWNGAQTTLLQSGTRPSEEWTPWPGGWALPFRHPALVANTAVTLEGGIQAAALLLTDLPADMTVRQLAALVAHEAFHVYQGSHGAGWPQR